MKCDMHNFWVWVYDKTAHAHRDPVANVVIYSSLCLFGSALGLIFGVPAFVFLSAHYPCAQTNGLDANDVAALGSGAMSSESLDSCHFILGFSLAIYTMLASTIGIVAGETHKPLIYSIFGGLGFVAIWAELYSFSSLITMLVMYENRNAISALDDSVRINAMSGLAVGGHAIALYSIIMAIRYSWRINFYFTRQEKLVYAERLRQAKWKKLGKERDGQFGVADIDDDHQFNIGGMEKGLKKMYAEKEYAKKQERKQAELERIEEEEDARVIAEQKGNLF